MDLFIIQACYENVINKFKKNHNLPYSNCFVEFKKTQINYMSTKQSL